jgi:hypothetical protein
LVDESIVVKQKTKKLPSKWSSEYQAVYYELDRCSLLCREETYHNKDSVIWNNQISERQCLTVSSVSLPPLVSFFEYDETSTENLEKKRLKETQELSAVQIPLIDYKNFRHLLAFEKAFNSSVGFKNWSFRNRVVWEELAPVQFSLFLAESLQLEPEVLSFLDQETDCLHLAFFFKSVPGRQLFKQWQAEQLAVPSFDTFRLLEAAEKARKDYLPLAEDEVGVIREQRVLALPADNSRVDLRRATAFHQTRPRATVHKRDVILGLAPTAEQDTLVLRELVRRETMHYTQKRHTSAEVPEEEGGSDQSLGQNSPVDDDNKAQDESVDVLLDDHVSKLKLFLANSCEFFINFENNPRLLFETSLQRVDQ